MMRLLLDILRARGSCGVHLQVSPSNTRALDFYRKLGFEEIHRDADDVVLGKCLAP